MYPFAFIQYNSYDRQHPLSYRKPCPVSVSVNTESISLPPLIAAANAESRVIKAPDVLTCKMFHVKGT